MFRNRKGKPLEEDQVRLEREPKQTTTPSVFQGPLTDVGGSMSMSYKKCQFTWLKQKETLVSLAESLLKDSAFYDCQLCAEGYHFNVHRVILSCNSPVFSSILQEHNSDFPVITLEGISSVELGALVEFMYTGITRIDRNFLRNFFQIAKSLQLAGLDHYDNAQIDKIINDSDAQPGQTDFTDSNEPFTQRILKYLDQSEASNDSEVKDLPLNTTESIFLENSVDIVDIISDSGEIYKHYSELLREDNDMELMDSQPSKAENNGSGTDGPEVKEEENLAQLQKNLELINDEKNFIFFKLENDALEKLKESQPACRGKQILSKNESRFYTKKCLRVINPVEKNFLIKRPKIQNLVGKDTKPNGDDKKIYICLKCGNKYSHRRTLLHHIHWICNQPATYSCSLCPYRGKRKFQLKSHMKHAHLLKMS